MMFTKYNAKKTVLDGHKFDSMLESRFYQYFKNNGIEILEFQPRFLLQEKFKLHGKCIRAIEYVADFRIKINGVELIVDSKGMVTPVFAIKEKMWLKLYGSNHTLIVVSSIKKLEATLSSYTSSK